MNSRIQLSSIDSFITSKIELYSTDTCQQANLLQFIYIHASASYYPVAGYHPVQVIAKQYMDGMSIG